LLDLALDKDQPAPEGAMVLGSGFQNFRTDS
jgi:hypothetical protein